MKLAASWLHGYQNHGLKKVLYGFLLDFEDAQSWDISRCTWISICTAEALSGWSEAPHIQSELIGTLHDLLALLGSNVVGDFHAVLLIVHEKHLKVRRATHNKLVEAILQAEPGLLVRAISNLGAKGGTLESSAHTTINASWLAPGWVHALEAIGLEAGELLRSLLHNLSLVSWSRHGYLGIGSLRPQKDRDMTGSM